MNPHHPSPPVPVHSLKFKWKKGKSERQEWVSSPAEPVHGHTRDLDRELIIFKQECKAERLSEELIRVSPHTLSQRWAIPITLKMKDQVHLFGQCFHWLRFWSELSADGTNVKKKPMQWMEHLYRSLIWSGMSMFAGIVFARICTLYY